jgi:hypothetical protein
MTLALAVGLGAMAQDSDHAKKTAAERAQKRTAEMTTDLGLNADQQAKVADINFRYADAMAVVKTIKDDAARNKREDVLKTNRDNSYKTLLTEDQYNKLMAIRAEKKAKHKAEKDAKKSEGNDSDD